MDILPDTRAIRRARLRRPEAVRPVGRVRLPRRALLIGTALQACSLLVVALPAAAGGPAPNAQPTGGQVVAGNASIGHTATQTTITQSSQRAAVNWTGFDVGSQQSVTFQQPSSSAVTLNRVTGPDPSQIAGHIQANGQVVLTNQSGVVFTKGAQVDTAGLIVSSAGISDRNFMAGRLVFDQPGKPGAAVVNEGTITVRQAGLAALVAPQVANSGTITARLGHVVLAGARAATLDLYGDGLVSIDVTRQVTEAPVGPDGKPVAALVTNTGAIAASGGTVQLTAAAVDGVVTNLVTAGGRISAATRHGRTGTIVVDATGGSVAITGTLAAEGHASHAIGGQVQVNATDRVTLAAGSRVSVAGRAGGGTVGLGTTLARARGGPGASAPAAKTLTVAAGATVVADATGTGQGGRITLLSSGHTQMDGALSAKGSSHGGFVEISGNSLGITGQVDVSGGIGTAGTILLDPDNLTIVSGTSGTGTQDSDFTINGGTVAATDANAGANSISNGVINVFTGNVLLQANRTLTVAGNIALTSNPAQNLTLEAGGTIAINQGVSVVASGNVILATGGAGPGTAPASQSSPLISVAGTVASLSGSVSLLAGTGAISIPNGGALVSARVDLGAAAGVTEAVGAIVSTQTLTSLTGLAGTVNLAGTANAIGAIAGLSVSGGSFSLVNTTPLVVSGMLAAAGVQITDGGAMTVTGSILPSGGSSAIAVGLTAASLSLPGLVSDGGAGTTSLIATAGGISQTGTLIAGTLSGSATGVASLTGFAPGINQIATLGNFSGSLLGLVDSGNLTIAGAAQGGSAVTVIDSGTVTVSGTIAPLGGSPINVGVTAASIALPGLVSDGGSGTTVLSATSGGIVQTGTLIAGTLSGASSGSAVLNGAGTAANQVVSLGNFTAGGAFSLNDGHALIAGNTIQAGSSVSLQDATTLRMSGTIRPSGTTAIAVGLTATSLDLPGLITDGGAGAVSLVATAGGISQTGTLIAGTLSGSAIAVASLTGSGPGINQIATLGNFSATVLGLVDATNLTISGLAQGSTGVSIIGSGTVLVSGTIAPLGGGAIAVGITGTSIGLSGLVSDGGGGTTVLSAGSGGIAQTGTLIAGTLSGSTSGSASLTGAGPAINQVANLGNFAAGGAFSLNDGHALIVGNTIQAGSSISLLDAATLRMSGTIAPGGTASIAVGLTAASLDLPGLISDGGTGSVSLVATAGAISQTGTLIAGTVSGSATRAASLNGSGPGIDQVATLGNFSASGLSLFDASNLTISGLAQASTNVAIIGSGTVLVSGTIAPLGGGPIAVGVTGASIGLSGLVSDGGGGTTVLSATAGGIVQTGTLISGTLSGSTTGNANLTGAGPGSDQVATLGNWNVGGAFSLNDGHALSVANTLQADRSITLHDVNSLQVSGTIEPAGTSAIAVGLTAASLNLPGLVTDGGSGTVSLVATTSGGISQTGTLIAGTLSGSAAGITNLQGTVVQVATLGNFSASVLGLADSTNLTVAGIVQAGIGVSIRDTGTITATGTIAPSGGSPIAVGLTAASIGLSGLLSDGGSGTTVLAATGGGIVQTGTLIAGTLSGSASGSAALSGAGAGINQVATLGNFNVGSAFSLNDGLALSVSNTLLAGASVSLRDTASLTVGGTIAPSGTSAIAVGLTASSVLLPGLVNDGGSGTTALQATTGSIVQSGTLSAGTLSGSAAASIGLIGATSSANTIAALGSVTAGTDLSVSTAGSLAVTGSLSVGSGHTIALRAADLSIGAAINAPSGEVDIVPLSQGGTISLDGARRTGVLSLVQSDFNEIHTAMLSLGSLSGTILAGAIQANGTALAGQSVLGLYATGAIAGSGAIGAAQVTGQAGSVSLTGANAVQSLGNFISPNGFTLNNGVALAVIGAVSAGPAISITDSAAVSLTGALTANSVSLTGASLALSGPINASGSVALTATAGGITDSGVITTGTLSGSAAGDAVFSGANQIASVRNVSSTGSLTLNDAADLTINGTVTASTQITLTDRGTIGGAGILSTALLTGTAGGAVALTGTNQIAALGSFTAASGFTLTNQSDLAIAGALAGGPSVAITDAGALTIPGSINARAIVLQAASIGTNGQIAGSSSVALTATTGTIQGTGTIATAALTGSAATSASLTGPNAITTIGPFTATTGLTLNDLSPLTVTGGVTGGSFFSLTSTGSVSIAGSLTGQTGSVRAASLAVAGTLTGTNSLSLTTTAGSITGAGTVATAALTGSSATNVALTGANQIAALGNFSAANSFTLNNLPVLSITGTVAAGTSLAVTNTGPIAITGTVKGATHLTLASSGSITETGATLSGQSLDLTSPQSIVLNGGTLLTGGTIAVGKITTTSSLIPLNGGGGALLTSPVITQTGTLAIRGATAIDPVAELVSNGTISLATLDAPQTWLILDMQAGRASATNLNLQRLDLLFTGNAVAAGLVGSVGGQSGNTAAEGSYILPQTDPNYILNGCPIASASCIVVGLTREAVPAQKPLSTIDFDAPKAPTDDPDLFQILPNISKQDY
jgi:filamentous hemagglutinin family protein